MGAESLHWYTEEGEDRHGASLREAKKEDLLPSVTKIGSILANHSLIEYAKDQVLQAALYIPPEGRDYDEWKKLVMDAANEHRDSAAGLGTMLHGWTELYLQGKAPPTQEYQENKDAARVWEVFSAWLASNLDPGGRQEITMVSKKHRYAGRTDYVGPMIGDDREFIIDWKFRSIKHPGYKKDGDLKAIRKPVYDTDVMQLSAYAGAKFEMEYRESGEDFDALPLNETLELAFDGTIQPVSVVMSSNPGFPHIYIEEWSMDECKKWYEGFLAARTLAKAKWGI